MLDDRLGGGFPRPSTLLLFSDKPTEKRVFAENFVVEGAKAKETTLYVDFYRIPSLARADLARLRHGYVAGFLNKARPRKDVESVALFDADPALTAKCAKCAPQVFDDLDKMLETVRPEAVAAFTGALERRTAV